MRLLVLLIVLSFVSFHHCAFVGDSTDRQHFRYHPKIVILSELIVEECPQYIHLVKDLMKQQRVTVESQADLVQRLEQQLIKCKKGWPDVDNSLDFELHRYNSEIKILFSILTKECSEYLQQKRELTDLQQVSLRVKAAHLRYLKEQLVKCEQDKRVSTTSRSMAVVTDPAPFCSSYDGDSVFNMQFITYNNPTNKKAPGVLCRTDGSPCNISLEICVSPINSKNCGFYHHVTNVVGEKPNSGLTDNFGNLTNPVKINLGNRKWQRAHVHVTVLERNPSDSLRVYRDIEEFSYDLTDVQGSLPKTITLRGERISDKTELVVMFTVPCPSPSATLPTTPNTLPTTPTTLPTTPTTLPTTPTTLPTTPTSSPVPAECLTANNLTQSWRLDHSGRDIKGGGLHSNGYACDLYDMGWFRFTGAAGTHMLDKCPRKNSCGTSGPLWTDQMPPQAVGVTANISAYAMFVGNCKWNTYPVQVMRCSLSTDHDLIYRYIGYYTTGTDFCYGAFCGMN